MPDPNEMYERKPRYLDFLKNPPDVPPVVDIADLERRVADLEDRARREDAAESSKQRLEALGFKFPGGVPAR
jgi:hypothetical protein